MRGLFEGWHIVILAVLVIALFGFKRLPDAARSIGRSMRVFKSEVDEMKRDGKSEASSATVPGETVRPTESAPPVNDPARTPGAGPVREDAPHTDNQSGPVA